MKRLMTLAVIALLARDLRAESTSGVVFDKKGQALNFTQDFPIEVPGNISFQVEIATVQMSTAIIAGGSFSSADVHVSNYDGMQGRPSTATLTFNNYSNMVGSSVSIRGKWFLQGTDWGRNLQTSTATAANFRIAVNALVGIDYYATSSSNVVTLVANASGTAANFWAVTSGTTSITTTTWANGQAHGYISINNVVVNEGPPLGWAAITSSGATALSISSVINNNANINTLILASTNSTGWFQLKSIAPGYSPYIVTTSSNIMLIPTAFNFVGGVASSCSVTADTFTKTKHGLANGTAVLFTTATGMNIAPLGSGQTYYVNVVDSDTFRISDVSTNAAVNAYLNLTAISTGSFYTFAPLQYSGATGFDWRASNDGSTFYALTQSTMQSSTPISSFTYTAQSPGGALWYFSGYGYRFIRFNYTGPTTGGQNVKATINKK